MPRTPKARKGIVPPPSAAPPSPPDDFLVKEYEQCIGLIQYYDGRQDALTKYAFAISTGVASVLLAITKEPPSLESGTRVFLCLVTCLALLALFALMVTTRIYFIGPSRQVNAIRKLKLAGFAQNRMWTNADQPAFNLRSSQTVLGGAVALQSGGFLGWGILSATGSVWLSLLGGALLAAVLLGVATYVLMTEDAN